jgi:D-amino-acid oxidase
MQNDFGRRSFLQGLGAAAAFTLVARARAVALPPERHFAPVKVSADRVIREVVGLRPYRDEGFVVAAERVGEKLIINNYGHGGAGITLSWGTASLAVDLLSTPGALNAALMQHSRRPLTPHFGVLGCGVNGLSTARLLQRRYGNAGAVVTIYAKDLPPNTTSNVAGDSGRRPRHLMRRASRRSFARNSIKPVTFRIEHFNCWRVRITVCDG